MAAECLAAIHLCRIRVTRLDATGNPIAGPNNVYVTDKPLQLGVTPVISQGADKELIGGCDCVIAVYRGYDKLKYFTFELDLGTLEPGLLEMLTGATIVTSGPDPVGIMWSDQSLNCALTPQQNLCFEAWQDNWDGDHQDPTRPYLHWIWPSTYWQIGAHTLANEFFQPKVSGFSRGNTAWGDGIYGDTVTIGPLGGVFQTATVPPAGSCGYQSHAIT